MEENKNINEEATVTEEAKVEEAKVEETKAEEPVVENLAAEETTSGEASGTEEDLKEFANEIVEKIKGMVKEGNVTRIRIRKGDTIILNLPMTVGLIGTALGLVAAPWALIIGTISTIGFKCTVEVENKDGSITVIHGKEK